MGNESRLNDAVDRLRRSHAAICALTEDIDGESARWRPDARSWSLTEIIGHLLDEEREDFRARLDLLLHHPDEDWPGINPERWVQERGHIEKDVRVLLRMFGDERQRSIGWLLALEDPDWDTAKEHPEAGTLRAGDLLCAWCVHDLAHIEQITRWHRQATEAKGDPYDGSYAL
ncbi:MAG TPA: DinB family protein [Planctomycetes bacterium]|nr:DinB family protein [Planctomycetota bacterium]HIN80707.1 DinB family protein [Planctomycetota bacterium]